MIIRVLWPGVPLVFAAWLLVLSLVTRLPGAAPATLVLFPPDALLERLPPGVAVLASSRVSVTLAGPGLAGHLADAGALWLLPAGLTGCAGPA